jgi:F0F1-type ATP synthase assembly protein I
MNLDANAGRFIVTGMEFGATVVAGVLVGYYLDMRVGTAPLLTLLFTVGGMGGALYRLLWNLKQSRSVSELRTDNDQPERSTDPPSGKTY